MINRIAATMIAAATVAYAVAQAPFTIVRPADGSKVKETIHILFPKNSVPKGGYIGIYVNGQFIEATVPETGKDFLDYPLDTKDLNLPDGPTTIEAVLYMNFAEKPRIMDRSSVQVTLANQADISSPSSGRVLRYHFYPGQNLVYDWEATITNSNITEGQAKLGGHAAETPINDFHGRMVYGIDNTYPGGDALVRIQQQPLPGHNALLLALLNQPQPRMVTANELYPVYMRIHNYGSEVYGLVPSYFGFSDVPSGYQATDILAIEPLPSLPYTAVKPGDSWPTRIELGSPDDVNQGLIEKKNSLVDKLPARGEFVDVEWELGHPCAKIHDSFEVGKGGEGEGADKIKSGETSVDETFWFALDKGVVVKLIRTETVDKKIEGQSQSQMGGGYGGPGMGAPGAPGRPGTGGAPTAAGLSAGAVHGQSNIRDYQFPGRGMGGMGKFGFNGGRGFGGPGRGPVGGGGNAPVNNPTPQPQNELTRLTSTEVFTLIQ